MNSCITLLKALTIWVVLALINNIGECHSHHTNNPCSSYSPYTPVNLSNPPLNPPSDSVTPSNPPLNPPINALTPSISPSSPIIHNPPISSFTPLVSPSNPPNHPINPSNPPTNSPNPSINPPTNSLSPSISPISHTNPPINTPINHFTPTSSPSTTSPSPSISPSSHTNPTTPPINPPMFPITPSSAPNPPMFPITPSGAPVPSMFPITPSSAPDPPMFPITPSSAPVPSMFPITPSSAPNPPLIPVTPSSAPNPPMFPITPSSAPVPSMFPVTPSSTPDPPIFPVTPSSAPVPSMFPITPSSEPVPSIFPPTPSNAPISTPINSFAPTPSPSNPPINSPSPSISPNSVSNPSSPPVNPPTISITPSISPSSTPSVTPSNSPSPSPTTSSKPSGLQVGFYKGLCPSSIVDVEATITAKVQQHFLKDPTLLPALLRMQFHDCFVHGCDASILIDGPSSEKVAGPNLSVRGYEFIDALKDEAEAECPGVVSCADIIAIATKELIKLGGGPEYSVETGRRDGLISKVQDVRLPSPFAPVIQSILAFRHKNITIEEMVALFGCHTVGISNCVFFQDRLYESTSQFDPNMDPKLREQLKPTCPEGITANNFTFLDQNPESSNIVDNSFFDQILKQRGILPIDQALARDRLTRRFVLQFAQNPALFNAKLVSSMIKLQAVDVLTGDEGEIRKVCSRVN
ncbi:vegetative cell wall protein gp1 [Beta vulgaris subsp. vulgaris]|uniref:vegetative cell wall protein gp1 n=1 Tax=Beta vulgaris subsp. vulgaris TaxID=3555 RepID=UPI00203714F4|nr:vegetative cell wall protein gp1 [Beta vulgaris subsp. vulgaris]